MTGTEIYAALGSVLVVTVLATGIARLVRLPPRPARLFGLAITVAALLPGLRDYGHGAVASLFNPYAPGVLVLYAWILAAPVLPAPRAAGRAETILAIALAALVIASALGGIAPDVYGRFYDPVAVVVLTGMVLAGGLVLRRPAVAALGPIGLLVWLTGLNGSENGLDAVFHPLLLAALIPGVLGRRCRPSSLGTQPAPSR